MLLLLLLLEEKHLLLPVPFLLLCCHELSLLSLLLLTHPLLLLEHVLLLHGLLLRLLLVRVEGCELGHHSCILWLKLLLLELSGRIDQWERVAGWLLAVFPLILLKTVVGIRKLTPGLVRQTRS